MIDTPVPRSVRASDAEREHAARRLRDDAVDGRMSLETFSRRVDSAYHARDRAELDRLRNDLPRQRPLDLLATTLGRISWSVQELRDAWERPRLRRLVAPASSANLVVGRSPECDLLVDDATVSRKHAELRRTSDGWLITDLSSLNGLRVNGARVAEVEIRFGDVLDLGAARLVFYPEL